MSELSWEPIREGDTYCSAACGRGCSYKEFLEAERASKELVRVMGPNWVPRVWENLGWHYEARSKCGRMKVSKGLGNDYLALFHVEPNSLGGRWVAHGKHPGQAVQRVYEMAKAEMKEIQKAIEAFVNGENRAISQ